MGTIIALITRDFITKINSQPFSQLSLPLRRGRVRVGVEKMTYNLSPSSFPLPFFPSHQGRGEYLSDSLLRGICRFVLSIPKGHRCNLDVFKTPFGEFGQSMNPVSSFLFLRGFFSVLIDLEEHVVIGKKLACILNACITRAFEKPQSRQECEVWNSGVQINC